MLRRNEPLEELSPSQKTKFFREYMDGKLYRLAEQLEELYRISAALEEDYKTPNASLSTFNRRLRTAIKMVKAARKYAQEVSL